MALFYVTDCQDALSYFLGINVISFPIHEAEGKLEYALQLCEFGSAFADLDDAVLGTLNRYLGLCKNVIHHFALQPFLSSLTGIEKVC